MEATAVKKKKQVHFHCRLFAQLQHNDSGIQTENKKPSPPPPATSIDGERDTEIYNSRVKRVVKAVQAICSFSLEKERKKIKIISAALGLLGLSAPLLIYSYKQNISKRFVFFMANHPLRAINSHQGSIVAKAALCFLENLIVCEAKQQLPNIYHRHVTRVIISP